MIAGSLQGFVPPTELEKDLLVRILPLIQTKVNFCITDSWR